MLFFDELPWLCGKNHRFLPALEHFWNDWAEMQPRLKVVVCGSAASWMVKRVVRARGGLHHRLTGKIPLRSFSISEVTEYTRAQRLHYSAYDLIKLYLVLGGIPYYLKQLDRGLSLDQNIDAMCFSKGGPLVTEFDDLYDSLFSAAESYKTVVALLGRHHRGLTRQQLAESLPRGSGGGLSQMLENLEASDLIGSVMDLYGKKKHVRLRLLDEFTSFSLRFQQSKGRRHFTAITKSPSFVAWLGLAFENFCLRHVDLLRGELGIAGVDTRVAQVSRPPGPEDEEGFEIDLLLDRDDRVLSVCEMKLSPVPFVIDKRYASLLRQRLLAVAKLAGPHKTLQHVFITLAGLKENSYSHELVDREIRFDTILQ